MLVRNVRTGAVGEVKDRLAKHLIDLGKCEEVKDSKSETDKNTESEKGIDPDQKVEPEKAKSKKHYKTKDMKPEA